ncbi:PKD domain-containing protein [Hoyosella sp. G463]|uniref:PKD domain-containing protein n=1 Tax=Lolliginicoccus lacisalsi TaxID=2742202 RepID=A0A927J9S8_9ACTN|nr:PKD domain-containing protein [Lolliginicoccus lacisalsi]MBD8505126.1 PKD domain-containing protein [Lolliginicoccus lacisalsi]
MTSEPAGNFTPRMPDNSTDLIAVAIQDARGDATLPPKGMGRLDLPASTVSGAIYLTIDPVALQFGTLLAALDMYGLRGSAIVDAFKDLSASYDCAGTAIRSVEEPDKESVDEFVDGLGDVANCVAAAAGKVIDADGKVAAHKIGVVASLLTTLPDQLKANLTGVFSPFSGNRRLVYTIEPKVVEQVAPEPTAAPEASPSRVIDRIDIDTWGYDRVGEHTYIAANNNTKKLVIYWKSFAGDEQIRGECTSSVTLVGAGRMLEEHESRCDSYNPGTTLRVTAPGTYTATVTVRQEGQSALSRQVIVTVLPFGS